MKRKFKDDVLKNWFKIIRDSFSMRFRGVSYKILIIKIKLPK